MDETKKGVGFHYFYVQYFFTFFTLTFIISSDVGNPFWHSRQVEVYEISRGFLENERINQ